MILALGGIFGYRCSYSFSVGLDLALEDREEGTITGGDTDKREGTHCPSEG